MKKLNFLYLFFVLFSFSSSQNFNENIKNSRMGLYISPAINFIGADETALETSNNPGLIYGYAFEIPLSENHYIESGFAISHKGGGITTLINNEVNQNSVTNNYKVQYLTIPAFIKMRSREIGRIFYFARIGPSLNFMTKESNNQNKTTAFPVIDISIFIGAEYSLGGATSAEASIFFNNGITDAISGTNIDALFHQIGLRFGFLF